MYRLDFGVVFERLPELLWGCLGTLYLALSGMTLALIVGVTGVVLRQSQFGPARIFTKGFVELIRNTPFLVQIFFLFFALPFMGLRLSPTTTAILALAINGGAYAIEIIRGGVESIHRGQTEAGLALGLSKAQVFRFIVIKPALRTIYPALTSQFIMLTLTTSICSSISAMELTYVAQQIDADSFRSIEVYLSITAIYLMISWLVMTMFASIGRLSFSYPTK